MTTPFVRRLRLPALGAIVGLAATSAFAADGDPLAALRSGVQPGCAVAILRPDGATYAVAGFADVEARTPITPRTRFLIASASKQFTALAVLTLVDQGRIGLDDPAERWIPDMAGALQGATVRQLLNQTAGVRDHTTLMALAGVERLGAVDPQAVLSAMRGLRSGNFPPGTRASYSNGNYLMLAQLVERVSGRSLADYAREAVFVPLGMADTGFAADPPMAHGYQPLRSGGFAVADDQPSLPGSGGLVTTVQDLARFDAAFRAGGPVWTSRVKAMFVAPGRLADSSVAILPEFGTAYGAGVGLEDRNGVFWLSHDGGSEGFRAEYARRAETPATAQTPDAVVLGAVVLCNRVDVDPGEIARAVSDPAPAAAEAAPSPPRPRPVRPPASEAAKQALVGLWRSDETGLEYDIRQTEDGVRVVIRSPFSSEPVTEDWNGLSATPDDEIATGPLRLKAAGDTLAVSFGRRVERLMFRRAD